MSKHYQKCKWLLLFSIVFFFSLPTQVSAEDGVAFSVRAVLPDNQRDKNQSYFDLRVEPNQVQKIETLIENSSDEEVVVEVQLNNATTNSNGVIVYDDPEAVVDSEYPLTSLAELDEEEITIQAGETASVFTTITVPHQSFEGVVLGGLRFQEKREELTDDSEGVAITNDYAYIIGLQLSENDTEIEPSIQLGEVKAGLSNYRTAVIADLHNTQPMILKDLAISAEVYQGDTLVRSIELEDVRIAPDSTMPVVIDWEDNAIEAGDYQILVSAMNELDEWTFDETFTISSEQEEEVNEEAVVIVEDTVNQISIDATLLYGIIILLFVAIGFLIIYIIKMRTKKN